MSSILLCLNPSKTEFIILGLPDQIKKLPDLTTYPLTPHLLLSLPTPLSALLALLLIHISLYLPTSATARAPASRTSVTSAASGLCSTLKLPLPLLLSIVHSKLDYCNSLFLHLESTQLRRLQLIQNSLARAVTRTPMHHHITPILKSLHWLKIQERIHFKVLPLRAS